MCKITLWLFSYRRHYKQEHLLSILQWLCCSIFTFGIATVVSLITWSLVLNLFRKTLKYAFFLSFLNSELVHLIKGIQGPVYPAQSIGLLTNPIMHQTNIPQCTILWQKYAHFSYKMVYCGMWNWYIVVFVQQVYVYLVADAWQCKELYVVPGFPCFGTTFTCQQASSSSVAACFQNYALSSQFIVFCFSLVQADFNSLTPRRFE